jgi:hypothetical protein
MGTRNWSWTAASLVIAGVLGCASAASAKPIVMPTTVKEFQKQQAALASAKAGGITPPAPPCPENGVLYPPRVPVPSGVPYLLGNCGVAQPAATSMPWAGNMAYYGGPVQVHPKEYLIYWGWGENGAWPSGTSCSPQTFTEGSITTTLQCDPDGAGKYMADFVQQMGGTKWADVSTQYYQVDGSGNTQYVSNDPNVLAGIWVDDTNDASKLVGTTSTNPAGPTNTYTMLAEEAARAAAHFGVSGADLNNANFVVIQPPKFSDPNALNSGYCAFHDYTLEGVPGNSYYDQNYVQQGLSYTNIPYSLAINSGGVNVCGENAVNVDSSNPNVGKLDGFSIVLGHEIEETITDPGAEATVGSGLSVKDYGGWYDTTDPNENGDKCAWVGENMLTVQGPPLPVPGALGDINGNAGEQFAVQSLWSNADNQGTGYCAGAGTDSPVPAAPYGNTSGGSPGGGGGSGGGGSSGGTGSSGSSTSSGSTGSSGQRGYNAPSHKSAPKKPRRKHAKRHAAHKRKHVQKSRRHTKKSPRHR